MAAQQVEYSEIPSVDGAIHPPKVHTEDQIRRFQIAMLEGGQQALNESVSTAKTVGITVGAAVQGDTHAQAEIHQFSKNLLEGLSNPDTYQQLAKALNIEAEKIKGAMDRGDIDTAGAMVGAAVLGMLHPGKKVEVVGDIAKAGAKAGNTLDDMVDTSKAARQAENAIDHAPAANETSRVDKIKSGVSEVLHRAFTPQNASAASMEDFKKALEGDDIMAVVKKQLQAVPGGWAGLGGGSAIAATMVTSHYATKKEEERAALPLNEQKAIAFSESAGVNKKEVEVLKKYPELQPVYEAYHAAVENSLKNHPSVGGQTAGEAASEIYRAKKDLVESIKNGALEHKTPATDLRSSMDGLTPEQKLTAAAQFIQTLPEHQRGAFQEKVAEYANKSGVTIEETHSHARPQEQEVQRT